MNLNRVLFLDLDRTLAIHSQCPLCLIILFINTFLLQSLSINLHCLLFLCVFYGSECICSNKLKRQFNSGVISAPSHVYINVSPFFTDTLCSIYRFSILKPFSTLLNTILLSFYFLNSVLST